MGACGRGVVGGRTPAWGSGAVWRSAAAECGRVTWGRVVGGRVAGGRTGGRTAPWGRMLGCGRPGRRDRAAALEISTTDERIDDVDLAAAADDITAAAAAEENADGGMTAAAAAAAAEERTAAAADDKTAAAGVRTEEAGRTEE